MARLLVVYDPSGRMDGVGDEARRALEIKEAILDIPDDLDGKDIYEIARKLAEILLEQV